MQGDRSVRSDRSQLLLLSQDQLVRSLPGQEELFLKKSSNPKEDDETVVMAVLHDKQEGTFDPLTSKDLIFDLGEREGLYRGCHPLLSGLILPF